MIEIIFTLISIYYLYRGYRENKEREEHYQYLVEKTTKLVTVEKVEQSGDTHWLVYEFNPPKNFITQGKSEKEAIEKTVALFPDMGIYQVENSDRS